MVTWLWILVLLLGGCTSQWVRHESSLATYEQHGQYPQAAAEERWLIDNAVEQAPPDQDTRAAEAGRYLRLADLQAKAGDTQAAVDALRNALTVDPDEAAAVRARFDRLPLHGRQRAQLQREFAWNIAALAPGDDDVATREYSTSQCWSYNVREIHIRSRATLRTLDGMESRVTYDARPWTFNVHTRSWHVAGAWLRDAGTVTELVDGPAQPRYRALLAADRGFYADHGVPPCHRGDWQGPFDHDGTLFVAAELPGHSRQPHPSPHSPP